MLVWHPTWTKCWSKLQWGSVNSSKPINTDSYLKLHCGVRQEKLEIKCFKLHKTDVNIYISNIRLMK